jgi:hypothetical protein
MMGSGLSYTSSIMAAKPSNIYATPFKRIQENRLNNNSYAQNNNFDRMQNMNVENM